MDGLGVLQDVDISRNELTAKSADMLTSCIINKKCKQIKTLDLSYNPLDSPSVSGLAESLFRTNLVQLHLAGVGLDHRAAKGIAFLLDNSTVLEELDLSWNMLGPVGCAVLAEALRYNQSVLSIDLSHNALGADGGASIGEVRTVCTTVFILAEPLVRSPRKLLNFIIKKYIYRIKVSKNKLI